ncbi:hypothetical protein Y032_0781g2308 [Ancylostoma ceylanicum]|uniref:Uncharacterized protein n=1 Tax=Ancylostoma ceylanicum TaxID=53326 RepID=A0A016WD98_9BILA|nr:hypothetical protein Y032_0781g2308 [Ancylostoma ceylanicum]
MARRDGAMRAETQSHPWSTPVMRYSTTELLLQNAYDDSDNFTVSMAEQQGCFTSPLLVNTVVDAIMRTMFENRVDFEFGQQQFVTDVCIRYNIALTNNETEAKCMLDEVSVTAPP